ncbi:Cna B-type domain-containing protein, partial [Aerococcaceae bacterium NML190938]|nr:Cna B-type domain-containing protein [Aerococcaceae bacterium NML190938]
MYRSRKFSSLFIILLMIINVVVSPLRIFAESAENVNEAAVMSLVASVEDVEHSSEEYPFGTHNIDEDIEVTPPANDTPPTTNENEVGNNPITDSHQGSEEEQSSEEIVDSADTTESEDKEQDKNDDQDKEQDKQQRTEPMEIPGTLTSVILRKDGMELNDGAFLEYDGLLEATLNIVFADSLDIQAGDTYRLVFPSALSFQGVSNFSALDSFGNVVGEAAILSGENAIIVTFNDFFQPAQTGKKIELKLVLGWNHSNTNEGETHYLDFGELGINLVKESQLMLSPASRDAVTNITIIKESTGEPLNDTVPLGAWGYLKVTVEFAVPNDGGYKAGDKTVVKLPDEMIFAGLTPSIVLEHQGTVIGHLTFSEADRTATITYAPGVEEKSDIKGSFFFSMRVDHRNNVHPHPIPQRFNVDFGATNRIIDLGNLNYTGKPLSPPTQFSKNGYFIDAGRTLHYDIVINQQNALMENVVLEDVTGIVGTMRDLRVLLGEYYVDSDNNRRLRNTVVLNVQPTYSIDSNGDRRFRLELGTIPEGKGIAITYKIGLDYQAEIGEPFENRATLTWNTVEEQTRREVEIYTTAGAVIEGSVFAIEMKKVDEAGQPLPGAKFEVIRDISGKRVGEIVTGSDGTGRISNLLRSNYTIREIEAPPGYELVNDEIKVKADEFSTPTKSVTKTVTNKLATTTFTVTKKWVNGEATNRPEVQFQLKRDGVNYGPIKTLAANSQDGATIEWTGLPKYKDNKTGPSVYTVEELPATNYVATISEVTATTATVTNTYTNEEKININVMKKWEDYNNKFQTRPNEISIKLKRNGQLLQTLKVTAANNWRVEVTNLHKYDSSGRAYEYTVEEDTVPGYKAPEITGDVTNGFTVKNKYCNTEKVNISGKKSWQDYNNKFNTRPTTVTIHLLQNGTKIKRQEVQGNGNEWNFSFTDLPKYDSQGDAYTYTVEEDPVANYDAPVVSGDAVAGFTVTNTYRNTETVDISGKKTWDDANNQDNKRPGNITVQVMNGNQKVAGKTVSQA